MPAEGLPDGGGARGGVCAAQEALPAEESGPALALLAPAERRGAAAVERCRVERRTRTGGVEAQRWRHGHGHLVLKIIIK